MKCIGKKPKYIKAQEAKGVEQMAHTEGAVFLCLLAKCNNTYLKKYGLNVEGIVNAKMMARGLKFNTRMSFIQKKQQLKMDEHKRKVGNDEEWKKKEVQNIVPQSALLKLFLDKHHGKILSAQHEIEMLVDDEEG